MVYGKFLIDDCNTFQVNGKKIEVNPISRLLVLNCLSCFFTVVFLKFNFT